MGGLCPLFCDCFDPYSRAEVTWCDFWGKVGKGLAASTMQWTLGHGAWGHHVVRKPTLRGVAMDRCSSEQSQPSLPSEWPQLRQQIGAWRSLQVIAAPSDLNAEALGIKEQAHCVLPIFFWPTVSGIIIKWWLLHGVKLLRCRVVC